MSFDLDLFRADQFSRRTKQIRVPELARYFKDGSEPVFTVRQLDGFELAKMREAPDTVARIRSMAERIAEASPSGIGSVISQLLNLNGDTPDEGIKHQYAFHMGVISPQFEFPDVVKIYKHRHATFQRVVSEILVLSAEGSQLGELEGCGQTDASETR